MRQIGLYTTIRKEEGEKDRNEKKGVVRGNEWCKDKKIQSKKIGKKSKFNK